MGASQSLVEYAAEETESALWDEYHTASSKQRLVIPLDTTEQLSLEEGSRLFIEWGILQPEDILYSTQQWLLTKIAEGKFRNTTLLIAGRGKAGAVFFQELNKAAEESKNCFITFCDIETFEEEQIREYFEALQKDWQQESRPEAEDMQRVLKDLLSDDDQLKLLALYTEGKPIYLSLYTEILVESRKNPEPLQQRFAEASGLSAVALADARKEIQAEFVRMLFYRPGLRSQIMQLLARATWGVTAKQIHFILDSKLNQSTGMGT
ncbi:MAG: hypothetical protein M5U34_27875 [Chloroflexi bacterium]|nr:hypothetical protein [Chloroflexota bacterium]